MSSDDADPLREEKLKRYKPGSIRRVKLQNFLTYADVEFYPGPRLNVVVGPNGTGKSTILCAICLGLGGQPKLLGRSDDARLFIMHERDIATVEIEIAPHENQDVHVLKRVIDRNKGSTSRTARGKAASTYYINGKEVRLADIQSLVSETYKIAVENLCTFLPQDKVGSFSGFDATQLLIETEKSVSGTQHLYNQHQRLIQMEEEMLNSDIDLDAAKNELEQLESQLETLEREKELMEQRQDSLEKLGLYKQKLAWVEFDNKRKEAIELKEERTRLSQKLKDAQKQEEPLKNKVQALDHTLNQGKQRRVALEREQEKAHQDYSRGVIFAEKCQDAIEDVTADLTVIDVSKRRAQESVKERQKRLREAETVFNEYPPLEEVVATVKASQDALKAAKKITHEKRNEVHRIQIESKSKMGERENLLRAYEHMKDDRARRNELILHRDRNLQQTYDWINQNRKLFRRKIWGPIVCEIETRDTDASNYLEQHVRNTVLKSYVVECREDYNLLFREVREKRKMRINIIVVQDGKLKDIRRMYSERMMNVLQREHGVVGYLDEVFDAPPAVMQALQSTSNVQSVLVGGDNTYESMNRKNLAAYLNEREDGRGKRQFCIFAKDRNQMYKYTSIISRYGNKDASLTLDEIQGARMLKPGVPPEAKEKAERDLRQVEEDIQRIEPSLQAATDAYNAVVRKAQDLQTKFNDAKTGRKDVEGAKAKVDIARRKLHEAETDAAKDNHAEKQRLMKKLKSHINNYVTQLENAASRYDEFLKLNEVLAGIRMSEDGIRASLSNYKQLLNDLQHQTIHLKNEYETADRRFRQMRNVIKQLKHRAVQMANIDADEELREKLDELSHDVNELFAMIEDAQEQIRSIQDNPQVLVQYEEQKKNLETQRERLNNIQDAKGLKRRELTALKAPYEAALDNITDKVNAKFGNYMSELGCAGEVRIYKGEQSRADDVHDFKNWGIQIRVKFRETSELQTLSARVHSGGERSVSTIMYLMAMQDMMVSPFRCVDEINQGLDDRNERLVFRRIVRNSTSMADNARGPSDHRGQYFLITPKLLPNLTDMETSGVNILCIFNGPYNFKHYNDWNVDDMLEAMRNHKKRKIEAGRSDVVI